MRSTVESRRIYSNGYDLKNPGAVLHVVFLRQSVERTSVTRRRPVCMGAARSRPVRCRNTQYRLRRSGTRCHRAMLKLPTLTAGVGTSNRPRAPQAIAERAAHSVACRSSVGTASRTRAVDEVAAGRAAVGSDRCRVISAAAIAPLAIAQVSSRPRNLPQPNLSAMIWQTISDACRQSLSAGSSGVAIVASEFPLLGTVRNTGNVRPASRNAVLISFAIA